jgi:anti-anti-sigma regulatory factor
MDVLETKAQGKEVRLVKLRGPAFTDEKRLMQLVESSDYLLVDLKDKALTNSNLMGSLAKAHCQASKEGRYLILLSPNPRMSSLLGITSLDKILFVYKDEPSLYTRFPELEQALSSLDYRL